MIIQYTIQYTTTYNIYLSARALQDSIDPYYQSTCLSVCDSVSETLMINISDTKQFSGSCPKGYLYESACGATIADVIDDDM